MSIHRRRSCAELKGKSALCPSIHLPGSWLQMQCDQLGHGSASLPSQAWWMVSWNCEQEWMPPSLSSSTRYFITAEKIIHRRVLEEPTHAQDHSFANTLKWCNTFSPFLNLFLVPSHIYIYMSIIIFIYHMYNIPLKYVYIKEWLLYLFIHSKLWGSFALFSEVIKFIDFYPVGHCGMIVNT